MKLKVGNIKLKKEETELGSSNFNRKANEEYISIEFKGQSSYFEKKYLFSSFKYIYGSSILSALSLLSKHNSTNQCRTYKILFLF